MLITGVNSYVTLDEAVDYVDKYYQEYDDLACHFKVLSDRDKEAYLLQAVDEIDTLMLPGFKYSINQDLAWPRRGNIYKTGPTVPDEVKSAQIEDAISIFHDVICQRSNSQIMIMSSLGVVKNWKYDIKAFGAVGLASATSLDTGTVQKPRLMSETAEKMLRPWIGGV